MNNFKTITAIAVASLVFAPMTGALAASNGINALIQVTQLKSQDANDEALHGADKQRDLVKKQKALREVQSNLSTASARKPLPATYQIKKRQINSKKDD